MTVEKSFKKWLWVMMLIFSVFVIIIVWQSKRSSEAQQNVDPSSAIAVSAKSQEAKAGITSIDWDLLYELDYKTGKGPDKLMKLHKTKIRMPGFLVPLDDDLSSMKEFLLVPNAQACVHVPPPPPNLIVHVHLKRAYKAEELSSPAWIEGELEIVETKSMYGASSYKLVADKIEAYEYE